MTTKPVLVIHGGTGRRPPIVRLTQIHQALRVIAQAAYDLLQDHAALETVVWTVARLEDDPLFNAGTGSVLQADGRVRMSASVMDGPHRRFAAVLNIERVRHPVEVARLLLEENDRVLAARGAIQFARARGVRTWNPVTPQRRLQWRQHRRDHSTQGTVGAVALDRQGRLAAATSTGGKGFEYPGRVSDSGLPVGNYADERVAISCTGVGEDILDEALAVRIAQQVADGRSVGRTMARTVRELRTRRRRAGLIALDDRGRYAWSTTLPVLLAVAQTSHGRYASF